jgi:hypothetical protein
MTDESKNKAGLPDKKVRGLFCFGVQPIKEITNLLIPITNVNQK